MFTVAAELPPPLPVRVSPRYIALDASADLVLEARFRGNFWFHDWVYSENDPYLRGFTTFFHNATRTNVGQTFTIPAGSAIIKAGYFGPRILPTSDALNQLTPTPENAVIVGPFSKCTVHCKCIYVHTLYTIVHMCCLTNPNINKNLKRCLSLFYSHLV